MANKIELILQTKLESAGSLEQAKTLGGDLAKAVSNAFDGVGVAVADKIFSELRKKLQESPLDRLVVMGNGTQSSLPAQQPQMPMGSTGSPGFAPPYSTNNNYGSGATAAGKAFYNPFDVGAITRAQDFVNSRIGQNDRDPDVEARLRSVGGAGAASAQAVTDRLRLRGEMAKINPGSSELASLTPSAESLKSAKGAYEGAFGALAQEIKQLTNELEESRKEAALNKEAIQKNNDLLAMMEKDPSKMAGYSEAQVKEMQSMRDRTSPGNIASKEGQINEAMRIQSELRKRNDELNSEATRPQREAELERQQKMGAFAQGIGKFGAVAGMIGQGLQVASGIPGMFRERTAGQASLSGFTTRSMMRGDTRGVYADELYGGVDSMRSEASMESGVNTAGKIIGGLGAVASAGLAGAAAGSIVPGLGTIVGAGVGIGGALMAGSGVYDAFTHDKKTEARMKEIRATTDLQHQEQLDMMDAGLNRGAMSFTAASSMGDARMSNFLYGSAALKQGASLGISSGETTRMLQTMASGSMGGNGLDSDGVQKQMLSNMGLQARGFSNMADVSSSLFTGGMHTADRGADLEVALKKSEEMFARAFGSGMNIAKIPEILATVAQEASRGTGAADQADVNLNRTLDISQKLGLKEGNQVGLVQQTIDSMNQAGKGSGLFGQAKYDALDQLNESLQGTGKEYNATEIMGLKATDLTKEGLAKRLGVGVDDKAVTSRWDKYQKDTLASRRKRLVATYGGDLDTAAMRAAIESGGAQTDMDLGSIAEAYKNGDPTMGSQEDLKKKIADSHGQDKSTLQQAAIQKFSAEANTAAEGIKVMADALPSLNKALSETIANLKGLANDKDYLEKKSAHANSYEERGARAAAEMGDRYLPKRSPQAKPGK
jgi:hypothetical protein